MPDENAHYLKNFRPDGANGPADQFVQTTELDQVAARRQAVHDDPTQLDAKDPLAARLVGLAFSGGGIRSATFNLGILQALGRLKLLTRVDYLSTVSGGGYIGAWLAAWVRRAPGDTPKARVEAVQENLNTEWTREVPGAAAPPPKAEPEPVQHLREHSRYLALKASFLSLDLWALVAIYLRNVFINLLVVAPLVLSVVFLGRLLIALFAATTDPAAPVGAWWLWVFGGAFVVALVFMSASPRISTRPVRRDTAAARADADATMSEEAQQAGPHTFRRRVGFVVACLGVAALGVWFPRVVLVNNAATADPGDVEWRAVGPGEWLKGAGDEANGLFDAIGAGEAAPYIFAGALFSVAFVGIAAAAWLILRGWNAVAWLICGTPFSTAGTVFGWRQFCGIIANGFVFGVLYTALVTTVLFFQPDRNFPVLYVTFGPPLFILAVLVGTYVEVGLAGDEMNEFEREWRSRMGAILFRVGFVWMVLFGAVAFVPYGLREANNRLLEPEHGSKVAFESGKPAGDLQVTIKQTGAGTSVTPPAPKAAPPAVPWAALVGWLLTSGVGYVLARRATPDSGRVLILAVRVVPLVFLVGLLAIASELSLLILPPEGGASGSILPFLTGVAPSPAPDYITRLERTDWAAAAVVFAVFVAGTVVAVAVVPANQFSLHSLYMNRLTRCYLGASRTSESRRVRGPGLRHDVRRRAPNRFSGFDPRDDVPLTDLRATAADPYPGPYPLFNTALNLVGGDDLAYQDRKGSSFVLTPDYCGSEETGYARLTNPDADTKHNLTVGRAMTISGAAIDPNMKDHQSGPLTAFLTILNARLGWWIENPKALKKQWTGRTASVGAGRYLQELAGYTTADRDQVHLSDGGHFDASGAYELIRRRCRYVIAIDAAEDVSDASENLANLIRLVRADFGVAIEIDTAPLRKDDKGISRWHCAVGAIRYDEVDEAGVAGTFVFIRSSLTGDEPADLKNYADTKPPFPHHSTADQFFDDVQFESYRRLGEHVALSVFAGPGEDAKRLFDKDDSGRAKANAVTFNRWLFSELRRRWAPSPPGGDTRYAESCRDHLSRHDGDYNLAVSRSLYPELKHLRGPVPTTIAPEATPAADESGVRVAVVISTAGADAPSAADVADKTVLDEMNAVSWLFMSMELAWLDNDLSDFHAHPLHRGWMNALRRWTASEQFHRFWAVLRPMYSRGFVRFCERTLNMPDLPVRWCRVGHPARGLLKSSLEEFDKEFGKEWSEVLQEPAGDRCPREAYISTAARAVGALCWLITVGKPSEDRGKMEPIEWESGHIPLGVVVAFPTAKAGVWELLVWIRPWYRSAGLARMTLAWLLPVIREELPADVEKLVARYPVVGWSGGDRLVRTMWTQFFNDLGFVRDAEYDRDMKRDPMLPRERRLVLRLR